MRPRPASARPAARIQNGVPVWGFGSAKEITFGGSGVTRPLPGGTSRTEYVPPAPSRSARLPFGNATKSLVGRPFGPPTWSAGKTKRLSARDPSTAVILQRPARGNTRRSRYSRPNWPAPALRSGADTRAPPLVATTAGRRLRAWPDRNSTNVTLPTQARPGSIGSVPGESTAWGPLAAAVGAATRPASSSTTSERLMPLVHPPSRAGSREMSIRAVATVNGVTTGHPGQALRRGALRRLRVRSWPILQTAAAAVAAWYLATLLVAEEQPVFAAIAAVISLGATYGQRPERAVELVGGVVLGIGLADLLVGAIGSGPMQLGLLVLLAMGAAVALGGGPLLVTEAAVSASLLVLLEPTSAGLAPSRLIEALVGGGVALAVSALAFPPNPLLLAARSTPSFGTSTRRWRSQARRLASRRGGAPRAVSSTATRARRGTSTSPSATPASSRATRPGACGA